jgi:hypothetical protein
MLSVSKTKRYQNVSPEITAWVAPCSVWTNTLTSKSYFLLISNLTATIGHGINILALLLLVQYQNKIPKTNPPIFHCFSKYNNFSSSVYRNYSGESDLVGIFNICNMTDNCLPVIRLCSENEEPTDLLFNHILIILLVLFFFSLCSTFCLQFLGNYLTMYYWSKIVFLSHPILHLSLIHDFLRNSETLEENIQNRNLRVVYKEISRDNGLLNRKNVLFGETCLHAALDGNQFDILLEMVLMGGDALATNIYDDTIEQILEEKYSKSTDKKNKESMKQILYAIQTIGKEEKKDNNLRVWNEQPMHKAARKNEFGFLFFLDSIGGQWIAENEENRNPIHTLLFKFETEEISVSFVIRHWIRNIRDENGLYLLHYSSKSGLTGCLVNLITIGADVNVRNNEGMM